MVYLIDAAIKILDFIYMDPNHELIDRIKREQAADQAAFTDSIRSVAPALLREILDELNEDIHKLEERALVLRLCIRNFTQTDT